MGIVPVYTPTSEYSSQQDISLLVFFDGPTIFAILSPQPWLEDSKLFLDCGRDGGAHAKGKRN